MSRRPQRSTFFPYPTLFRSYLGETAWSGSGGGQSAFEVEPLYQANYPIPNDPTGRRGVPDVSYNGDPNRSEEHTSELQSQSNLASRLLVRNRVCISATLRWP